MTNTAFQDGTARFLSEPGAILHIPRCVAIARQAIEAGLTTKKAREVRALIEAAEQADYAWIYGPSYHVDEAAFDANVAAVNAAGAALLKAADRCYT